MPKRPRADPAFQEHVLQQILSHIDKSHITDTEAAEVLGVSKQTMGGYRRRKWLPGTEAIARACVDWGLTFTYKEAEISARSFASENGKPELVPQQLSLPFSEPVEFQGVSECVRDLRLTITLKRVS